MNPDSKIIVAFDPGKSTGYTMIRVEDKKITPIKMGVLKKSLEDDAILQEANSMVQEADIVVIENFLVRPKVAEAGRFNWNNMVAPQVIGKIKTLASLAKKQIAIQEPAVKPVGYAWAGLKYKPGMQDAHDRDAMAHAVYFAVKNLGALPKSAVRG